MVKPETYASMPRAGVVVVDENDNEKSVTKSYPDGRSLTILLVDGVIVEKHMTYPVPWDHEAMKKEEGKGADGVTFKYWEKGGLAVGKSFYGSYLVGLMYTLDYTLVTNPAVKCEKLEDELDNDIAFPMVDVRKLAMEDGYTSKQKENPKLASIMHGRIVDALTKFEKDEAEAGWWGIG